MSSCNCTGACRRTGKCTSSDGPFKRATELGDSQFVRRLVTDIFQESTSEATGSMPKTSGDDLYPGAEPWKQATDREPPGFHQTGAYSICLGLDHNAPTHLFVPSGMKYVHYCSSCGLKTVLFGSNITC